MRDYNFFEIYEKKKGVSIQPKSTAFVCAVLIVLVILATAGMIARNYYLSNEIDAYNIKTEQIKSSEKYKEANQLKEGIAAMKEYDQNAEVALKKFQNYNLIGTELLTIISSSIPAQASLDAITMNNAAMISTFIVTDRKTASELLLSLKNTGLFKNVHLSSIAINEGSSYKANILCIMKEKTDNKEGEE